MTTSPNYDLFAVPNYLDAGDFEGLAGVYVLHFDGTVRYTTPGREPGTPPGTGAPPDRRAEPLPISTPTPAGVWVMVIIGRRAAWAKPFSGG